VDGLIIPDLPVDEAAEFRAEAAENDISTIFLVSPTSAPERVKQIDKSSTDFVYAVTVTGVTGAGKVFGAATDTYLKSLKRVLNRPFVAGFGVNTPEAARRMACFADGVVIGSALVEVVRKADSKTEAVRDVERFLKEIRTALS
jgi:tryptophan synthase alpha chain